MVVTPNSLMFDEYARRQDYLEEIGIEIKGWSEVRFTAGGQERHDYLQEFFRQLVEVANLTNVGILFGTVIMGIIFGALPGLTATLGVALLTTVTYSLKLPTDSAMVALLGIYVGAIYGGSHPAILLNIPGTAAAAAR